MPTTSTSGTWSTRCHRRAWSIGSRSCASALRGRRVVHLGFADARCAAFQEEHDAWLHATLADVASELVGLDLDVEGVEAARRAGFDAHAVDCRDPRAVAGLGLAPADVVIVGELIEHLDDPGSMLEAVKSLVAEGGTIVITTPNGHGLFNVCAAAAGRELNHPDHVALYSWFTLFNLLDRHGWAAVETAVYVPVLKSAGRARPSGCSRRALASSWESNGSPPDSVVPTLRTV